MRTMPRFSLVGSAVAALLLTLPSSLVQAQSERSLRWDHLDVRAHLDAEGRLLVLERHEMVFDGDWNGGERTFRVESGQDLELVRVSREETGPDGATRRIDLTEDEALDDVDDYAWTSARTLRWRSRLPSDPPFEETRITYVLEYVLSDILRAERENRYVLDHDFAFPDREWPVAAFSVRLTLDDAWSSGEGSTIEREARDLAPGQSFVVTLPLVYEAAGRPAGVWFGAPVLWRASLPMLLFLGGAMLFARRWRQERTTGRLDPLPGPEGIDREWLESHLLSFRPEVAGALWDEKTGAAEVTALLARLENEGKIASRVETKRGFLGGTKHELHLERRVPLERFTGSERSLIDALFLGSDTTSTSRVRQHYKSTGFDPASKLGRVKQRAEAIGKGDPPTARPRRWPTLALMVSGVALLVFAIVRHPGTGVVAAVAAAGGLGLYGIALAGAVSWRRQVHGLRLRALVFLAPCLFLTLLVAVLEISLPLGWEGSTGLALFVLGMLVSVANQARGRQSLKRIETRRDLFRAREHLRRELRRDRPDLEDAWVPWLLGLGLGPSLDRWSVGRAGVQASTGGSAASFSGSGGSGAGGFTGGGGSFGGAGASAAWSAAAAGMAAGVAAPSSSGGSGGGGGGGSSGGGGGGGW